MAKINITLNNETYQIDESAIAAASDSLKSHLSTTMSGSGAAVKLGNTTYNIDSTKLSAATNNFVSHLGTIAGSGSKVVVGGVEYGVDSNKVSGAVAELEAVLGGLNNPDAPTPEEERLEGDGAEFYTLAPTALSFRSTAPLNELNEVQINGVTVDPSNYTLEEGSTIVTFPIDYLKTLNVGNYEVAVASESKTVKGDFTVAAPELNEYGFYYNQPYAAYMDYFTSDVAMFIREDNTMDIMVVAADATETASYAVADGTLTITSPSMGELHCTFSANGMELYNVELGATLSLNNGVKFVADEDYFYIYKEDLGGYEVTAIDKTKAEYGAIKTGINGIDTVKLANYAFYAYGNTQYMTVVPETPNSVSIIGEHAFENCYSLMSAVIGKGVTSIGSTAFDDCTGLMSVVIGENVTNISGWAFMGCTSLVNITFKGTMAQWNAITKAPDWKGGVPATYVQCSDGQVAL